LQEVGKVIERKEQTRKEQTRKEQTRKDSASWSDETKETKVTKGPELKPVGSGIVVTKSNPKEVQKIIDKINDLMTIVEEKDIKNLKPHIDDKKFKELENLSNQLKKQKNNFFKTEQADKTREKIKNILEEVAKNILTKQDNTSEKIKIQDNTVRAVSTYPVAAIIASPTTQKNMEEEMRRRRELMNADDDNDDNDGSMSEVF
jgi:hypothetical protein